MLELLACCDLDISKKTDISLRKGQGNDKKAGKRPASHTWEVIFSVWVSLITN